MGLSPVGIWVKRESSEKEMSGEKIWYQKFSQWDNNFVYLYYTTDQIVVADQLL